ncbi:MAG: excinuclease ABC subunit UvrC [Lachnospiraceae bacterium]|nr:excinuclease ABC subunit UvrC [Lachnospiraceae bacterium]
MTKTASGFVIEEELKKLPMTPGVYLMRDADDQVIYVGKAVKLRNRVRSYFRDSVKKSPKIERMVTLIDHFEYIVCDSEMEALVLECNLIKEYAPKYNTMLKDDKAYPYIRVTLEEEYPRLIYAHQMRRDRSRYFGPYTNAGAVHKTLELLHSLFRIRTCRRVLPRDIGKERPCLNYHIHRCAAPCQGYISKEEYAEQVKKAVEFLEGKYGGVLETLEKQMTAAAEALEFEEAQRLKEQLFAVRALEEKQRVTETGGEDRDIVAAASEGPDAVVQIFFIREGRMIGRDHFHLSVSGFDSRAELLGDFVKQFYAGTPFIPREIFLQEEIPDAELVTEWLSRVRGAKCTLLTPKRGEKAGLLKLAEENARTVLEKDHDKILREERRTAGAAAQVAEWLGLPAADRMEAYDISNTQGTGSVGSMVVYEKGRPKRSDYRKFRIRTVQGPDDYASMKEVLTRRFERGIAERDAQNERNARRAEEGRGPFIANGGFSRFPDLILMDGGRGQVNIAESVLEELGLPIPVAGMVKDDHHRTRGLYFRNVEIPIDTHSEGFRLITRIQDEAHRFAIEYHRSIRGKTQLHSVLDDIPGIGPARRKALMRAFGDIEKIRAAGRDELAAVDGVTEAVAENIYRYFHADRPERAEETADTAAPAPERQPEED